MLMGSDLVALKTKEIAKSLANVVESYCAHMYEEHESLLCSAMS